MGTAPEIELRSVLDVTDRIDLEELTSQFDEALSRFESIVGLRPGPIQVSLRFRGKQPERQLE
jgi:hypothetical protein